MNVLVYSGRGASDLCIRLTISALSHALGKHYDVKSIMPSSLNGEPWETNCALLVIPGGRDTPYTEDISALGLAKIKRWVSEGGYYLGICAGSYFASTMISFDEGGPNEIIAARTLDFFRGTAVGPVGGTFAYDGHASATAQRLKLKSGSTAIIYCNGGCYFSGQSLGQETIAVYEQTEEAAIVKVPVGKGAALLSGVHFEFDAKSLEPIKNEIPFDLAMLTEPTREALWKECLASLGLVLSAPLSSLEPTPFRLYGFPADLASAFFNDAILASSYDDCSPDMTFDPAKFYKCLGKIPLGHPMIYAERIMSTQVLLRETVDLLEALPNGTICLAGDQLAGKGRGSNTWLSSTGCLQFTLVLDHQTDRTTSLSIMQYLVATAMCQAISKHAGKDVDVRIKWPNDIYAMCKGEQEFRKAGGILVNTVQTGKDQFRLLIGFGVNVYDTPWTVSINDVLTSHTLPVLSKEALLAGFLSCLYNLHSHMIALGGEFPFDLYYKYWLHTGETVWLQEEQVKARIEGIDKDGYLIAAPLAEGLQTVLYENGACHYKKILLQPDGNSFDLMKKLIKRK